MNADDWIYRVEGSQHLVFGFNGSSASDGDLSNTVLRLASAPRDARASGLREPEPPPESLLRFTRAVFLSQEALTGHIDPGSIVDTPKTFLRALASNAEPQRPAHRREKFELDVDGSTGQAMVFKDHIRRYGENNSYCVEIKPKSGPRMRSRLTSPEVTAALNPFVKSAYSIKHANSRPDGYDPADLLSGDKDRTWRALKTLQRDRAHILRVYQGGELVVADDLPSPKFSTLDEAYQSELCTKMMQVAAEVLLAESEAISALVELQGRDYLGGIGAEMVFNHLVELTGSEAEARADIWASHFRGRTDVDRWNKTKSMLAYDTAEEAKANHNAGKYKDAVSFVQEALTAEFAAACLGDYMVAGVAKDCSIMVSISRGRQAGCEDPSVIVDGEEFQYQLNLVDLEPKPFHKIHYWARRERDYVRKAEAVHESN